MLVALGACHEEGAARLFTPEETAALEKRVLDKVAETDKSCIRPELVELLKPDCPCAKEAMYRKDPNFAQYCANKLTEQIKTIAAAGVGCSPYQVGAKPDHWGAPVYDMWPTHIATLLEQRALAADDTASALDEIFDAIRVSQDATRGRVSLSRAVITATMESKLLATAQKLVTKKSLSDDQLLVLSAKVDALIKTEPRVVENLRGEALYMALHLGVVAIKGPLWIPPSGRSDTYLPQMYDVEYQEDFGATYISSELWAEEKLSQFCTDDNIAVCFMAMSALSTLASTDIVAEVRGAETLLALEPSEGARLRLQRRAITKSNTTMAGSEVAIGQRAHVLTRLAALRIQLDVLRAGKCPVLEANAIGTHYLRDSVELRQLGGPVQAQPVDGGIDILPPVWSYRRQVAARISCP